MLFGRYFLSNYKKSDSVSSGSEIKVEKEVQSLEDIIL